MFEYGWQCNNCGWLPRATPSNNDAAEAMEALAAVTTHATWGMLGRDQIDEQGFWRTADEALRNPITSADQNTPPRHNMSPPVTPINGGNSPLYVPLLHQAAQTLHPTATQAWETHNATASHWQRWAAAIRHAPPIPIAALTAQLAAETQARPDEVTELTRWTLARWHVARQTAALGTPPHTTSTAIITLSHDAAGYIPGLAQEVILAAFALQKSRLISCAPSYH